MSKDKSFPKRWEEAKMAYQPLSTVIIFPPLGDDTPMYLGYVASGSLGVPYLVAHDNEIEVAVTRYFDEAKEGRGTHTRVERVRPFSASLWEACEEWIAQRSNLKVLYDELRKGRVHKDLIKHKQMQLI